MTDYESEYQQNSSACGKPFPEFVSFFDNYSVPSARVLDLGCGQGRDALMIAERGHIVHGVDVSPTGIGQMVDLARLSQLKVTGEVCDVRQFEIKEDYDIVVIDRTIHMLKTTEEKVDLLEKAQRATLRGGYILIADTPGNMGAIGESFSRGSEWKSVLLRKGFRFYRKAV